MKIVTRKSSRLLISNDDSVVINLVFMSVLIHYENTPM